MATKKLAQASSGPDGAYLAAQVITGEDYVAPAGGAIVYRILSSVRTANGQVFFYYADDASGTNAVVISHHADFTAFRRKNYENLAIRIPSGKYLLTYGVGAIHDSFFSVAEFADSLFPRQLTAYANQIPNNDYRPMRHLGAPYFTPPQGAELTGVYGVGLQDGSQGYLYYADDIAGSRACVLNGLPLSPRYTSDGYLEDAVTIPGGKYVIARAETGEWSGVVNIRELPPPPKKSVPAPTRPRGNPSG